MTRKDRGLPTDWKNINHATQQLINGLRSISYVNPGFPQIRMCRA